MDCNQHFDERSIMLNDKAFLEKSIKESFITIDKLMSENSLDHELFSKAFELQEQVNFDKKALVKLDKELSSVY